MKGKSNRNIFKPAVRNDDMGAGEGAQPPPPFEKPSEGGTAKKESGSRRERGREGRHVILLILDIYCTYTRKSSKEVMK